MIWPRQGTKIVAVMPSPSSYLSQKTTAECYCLRHRVHKHSIRQLWPTVSCHTSLERTHGVYRASRCLRKGRCSGRRWCHRPLNCVRLDDSNDGQLTIYPVITEETSGVILTCNTFIHLSISPRSLCIRRKLAAAALPPFAHYISAQALTRSHARTRRRSQSRR